MTPTRRTNVINSTLFIVISSEFDSCCRYSNLTTSQYQAVVTAYQQRASHYVTKASGEIVRSPTSTDMEYKQARANCLAVLESLPDDAIKVIQALAWTGRGDSDGNLQANLESSMADCDEHTRGYLSGKPLEQYLPRALQMTGAVLAT